MIDLCRICKLTPYPRGFIVNLGICWTCRFGGKR